ncbi:hypothetical protein J6590_056681 [Homalodisca vitripennis]|nr:hypothetical protein J6590_056681 [Homalodisca vitripennis]
MFLFVTVKEREILKVTTGVSEYEGRIGALAELILQDELHGTPQDVHEIVIVSNINSTVRHHDMHSIVLLTVYTSIFMTLRRDYIELTPSVTIKEKATFIVVGLSSEDGHAVLVDKHRWECNERSGSRLADGFLVTMLWWRLLLKAHQ